MVPSVVVLEAGLGVLRIGGLLGRVGRLLRRVRVSAHLIVVDLVFRESLRVPAAVCVDTGNDEEDEVEEEGESAEDGANHSNLRARLEVGHSDDDCALAACTRTALISVAVSGADS